MDMYNLVKEYGTVYLSQILYNNDQKRKIEFAYESSNRADRRLIYEQGNVLEESRRLQDIFISFNDTLVRRYNFEFISLNNESSLSSLYKIRYFGSDNSSLLHTITFGYYESNSYYHNSTSYNVSTVFSDSTNDYGIRLADLNNDGYVDIIQGRQSTSEKKAWLNNKTGWNTTSDFFLPEYFVNDSSPGQDKALRMSDLNNDGFPDLIQGFSGTRRAWLNYGSGWNLSSQWAPSIDFMVGTVDQGTQLIDFNGDGKTDLLQAKEGSTKKAYLNTGNGWKDVSSQWNIPTFFVKSDGSDYGSRLVDFNGDGLIDVIEGYNFGTVTKNAWLNNGSGWVSSSNWIPPDVFTSTSRIDNGLRLLDLNGDGLTDILQDFKNGSTTEREAFINNGNGWSNSTSWNSPEPFTKDGKNIGRRIGDVDGDGFGDIIVGYNDGSSDIKRTLIRNATIPFLLKNITNEFGGLTYLSYSKSTLFNNTGDDGLSDIGFNVWVVSNVTQDNKLTLDFNLLSNTSYYYFGGLYNYTDSEFRGFNIVNETLSDKSIISHYFNQNKQLKGKEYKTEIFDSNNNIFSKSENIFNFSKNNNGIFIVNLLSTSSYTYDGTLENPKITNVSYQYDNYSNVIAKINFGDISIDGDEKYENYTYAVNISSWILDKPDWYLMFDSSHNKLRETKYFYDNHQYGDPPSKGELTKVEYWFNTGGGNPTTSFTYDAYGNLIGQIDALGRITKYEYGLTEITSTYPERITNALGHSTTYTYDIFGNVLTETKNGISKYNQYDTFGRIIKEILPYDDSDFPTKKYEYNFDGIAPEYILIKQRTTSNKTIDSYFFYDGFSNLVQIKTPADNGQQIVNNLFYDGFFRVSSEQNPYFSDYTTTLSNVSNTANKTKYNYDALSRITSIINPDGTTKTTNFNKWQVDDYDENNNKHTYLLDAYDRIKSVTEYNKDFYLLDNETYNTTYTYDGVDELTGIRDTLGNEFNFSYDSLGRKIRLKDPDLGTWSYEYDFAGNLVSQSGGGGNLQSGDNYYREYNGLGQLKSVKEGNNSNGRILEEYFYDANGDRIKINSYSYIGGTNETVYTPYKEWMQIRNSSGIFNFYYVYQDGTLVARLNPDGTKWFYHADHLGSTSSITDQNGNVVEDEFYSPFGESQTVNDDEDFKLYTGQFKDSTGQYYFGARYYIPAWSIFTSGDPIIQNTYDPQFLNHYAYARNNPYKLIDIDGREVYVILKDTNIPVLGNVGHIEFVVRNPDSKGYQFYSNTGPNTNDAKNLIYYGKAAMGLYTSGYKTISGGTKSDVFPNTYRDCFCIQTTEDQDRQIIQKANEIISRPRLYYARGDNSQDFVIEALEGGEIDIERRLLPEGTFSQAKKKLAYEYEKFNSHTQNKLEKTNNPSPGGRGGSSRTNVVADPSGRKDRFGNPVYIPRPNGGSR